MNIKNERGSLTLFVAISMLFFMTFLLTLYISTTNQQKTQLEVTARIKETYEQDLNNIEDVYNSFVGTADIIPIYTKEQLQKVGSGENVYISQLGKYYKFNSDSSYILKNNIELNNYTIDVDGNEVFAEKAEQWTPIGTDKEPFKGNFDGNGYKIDGLYINSKSNNLGLFGVMESGTIENLTVAGSVTGNQYIGGIVGRVVGNETSNINNCNNLCNVDAVAYVGGIIGHVTNINITNSSNKGNIKSSGNSEDSHIGGIIGCQIGNKTLVENCYNIGNINSSKRFAGGIIGKSRVGIVKKSYNLGNIISESSSVGGIVGDCIIDSSIEMCYNSGNIEGINTVSGIAGTLGWNSTTHNGYIKNCYNVGNIKINNVSSAVGSIVGSLSSGDIENCYNTGMIENSSNELKSGIIGTKSSDAVYTIKNCYYLTGTASGGIDGADVTGQAEEKSSIFMQSSDFVDLLGKGNWKLVKNENKNYPVLSWQEGSSYTNNTYEQDGLILWYDAIDNVGTGIHNNTTTTWKDLSINKNDGTLNNFDSTTTSGWSNDALNFDGTDDWVLTPIDNVTDKFTYEIVVKIPKVISKEEEYILNFSPNGGQCYNGIRLINSGKMHIEAFSTFIVNEISYNDYIGKRNSFVISATRNASSNFYVSGSNKLTFTSGNLSYTDFGTGNLVIGSLRPNIDNNLKYTGEICSVRVYNRALTANEVQNNYQVDKVRYGI